MTIYVIAGRVVYANPRRFRKLFASVSATAASFSNSEPRPSALTTTVVHITTRNSLSTHPKKNSFDSNGLEKIVPYAVTIESSRVCLPKQQRHPQSSADRAAC